MSDRRNRIARALALAVTVVVALVAPVIALAKGGTTSATGGATEKAASVSATTAAAANATTTATVTVTSTTAAPAKHAKAKPHKPVKPPTPVTGWLDGSTTFPQRTLVLSLPTQQTLSASQVHVTENGSPVGTEQLSSVDSPSPGQFGIEFVVAQNPSMGGPGLSAAMSAVRQWAQSRTANQQIGVVTFDAFPSLYMGLTDNPQTIGDVLGGTPQTSAGAAPAAAVNMALEQLKTAGVTLGAVVLISDGVGVHADTADAQAVSAAATASGTPIYTLGVRDGAATPASLQALSNAVPSTFTAVAPSGLSAAVGQVVQGLDRDYLVSYRSSVAKGHAASVAATVDGVPGTVSLQYSAPTPPKPAVAPAHPAVHHAAKPDFSTTTQWTSLPGFATPAVAAPAPVTSTPSLTAPRGFWASPAAIPVVGLACGALIGIALAMALYRPSRRAVRVRIGSFIPAADETVEDLLLREPEPEISGLLAPLMRSSWWPPFVEAVEIAGLQQSPVSLVKRFFLGGVVVGALLALIGGTPFLALIGLIAWPFALRFYVNRSLGKQRIKFSESLPSYLQDLASSIRVGRSFAGALAVVAESADEPTRGEFERAAANESLGMPVEESLESVSKRMVSLEMDQVALIAGLNRRSGSNIAESLDRVAEAARERADLRREMRALTAQAKMSSLVLTCLPGVLAVGMLLLSPSYAQPLFHTTIGIVSLVVGGLMVAAGWKVMQKITDVGEV